jgi:hypothetical protein
MFTHADGRKLAIQMLYEFQGEEVQRLSFLPARDRPVGKQQQDVLGRYLRALISSGDNAFMDGFTSVVTDFLGSHAGATPVAIYEGLSEADFGPGTMTDED